MPERPKQDFSGEKKKKDTYDADWTFVRRRHKRGPNDWSGAWMTKKQRKDYLDELRESRAARQGLASGGLPGAPAAAAFGTAPILGAGSLPGMTNAHGPAYDKTTPGAGAIPSWWINQAITGSDDPNAQFANAANALLPTLAPEDQRNLANYLATNFRDVYGAYANADFGAAPTEITGAIRQQYLSPHRAQLATHLLERMKQASGVQDMGGGYDFLKNAVNLINQFTTDGVLTRERYGQFQTALKGLTSNTGRDLSSFANLAQLFNMPNFTAGPLVSNAPNAQLFG